MKKCCVSLFVALVLCLSLASTALGLGSFWDSFPTTDVSIGGEITDIEGTLVSDWAVDEVQMAYELGLVPDCLLGVDLRLQITRAEFAAVCVKVFENLSGTKAVPVAANPFTDCSDPEVLKAYNIEVVNGMTATTFAPDNPLTREQAATMLTRVFKRTTFPGWSIGTDSQFPLSYNKPAPFADDDKISAYAKDSVYFMYANDIINGMGDNKFAPQNTTESEKAIGYANATRQQALIIAARMVDKLA
ncbi:MAG: S-layer homology domain-containing protein [Oscillospiraceae bacterium]|nr:S-layer homology domain-containing protein [Oscillospiraceae bacterium]